MIDLADLKVPGPTVIPLTEQFWKAAEEGRLDIQHCGACGKHVFYPRPICPHCWADALTWVTVCGDARLISFSEICKPGHPGWIPVSPYIVGLAQLDEGPVMLSHILTNDRIATVGDRLRFSPTRVGDRILPIFKLTDQTEK